MPLWRRREKKEEQGAAGDWFRETVRFYRQIGFFEEHKALSENDLVETLRRFMREAYYEPPDPSSRFADPEVMRLDDDRVWWEDLEADVCAENEVYSEVLTRLAGISRGALTVVDVGERWESDEGPITVEFTAKGKRRVIHPVYIWRTGLPPISLTRWPAC